MSWWTVFKKRTSKEWQKCPVCEGTGEVERGFYAQTQVYSISASTSGMLSESKVVCRCCHGGGCVEVVTVFEV